MAIGDTGGLSEAVDDAFPGSRLSVSNGDYGSVEMYQRGLLRPLGASELSDGTLRYLLLVAALLSPRPPELMILNEPEASLHPSLLDALARLLMKTAYQCQIVVVSHSDRLVEALAQDQRAVRVLLEKELGETKASETPGPRWVWPSR